MCTFGLSGCRVKPRRLWGRRETERTKMKAGEDKKREILGPPPFGAPRPCYFFVPNVCFFRTECICLFCPDNSLLILSRFRFFFWSRGVFFLSRYPGRGPINNCYHWRDKSSLCHPLRGITRRLNGETRTKEENVRPKPHHKVDLSRKWLSQNGCHGVQHQTAVHNGVGGWGP